MEWMIEPEVAQEQLWQALETTPPQADDDARRLFHGRGQWYEGLSFLSIDWYAPVLLLTLYRDPGEDWLTTLIHKLYQSPGWEAVSCIVLQKRFEKGAPSEIVWGQLPPECLAREDGLNYQVTLGAQQNIGFFLDMREARRWLRQHAPGKRVLNLFAFTCAFSVVAMAHGAESVTNLDMNRNALGIGKTNHQINQIDQRCAYFWGYDIFRSWSRLRKFGPYDLVIIDPPSAQYGSFVASKDYARLVKRLVNVISKDATLLACLNAPQLDFAFLRDTFHQSAPTLQEVAQISPPAEFLERTPDCGLKMLVYQNNA